MWILAATLGLVKFVHEEMKAYRWLRKKRRKISLSLSLSLSPSLTHSLSSNLSPSLSPSLSISLFFPFNLLPSPSISLTRCIYPPPFLSLPLPLSHTGYILLSLALSDLLRNWPIGKFINPNTFLSIPLWGAIIVVINFLHFLSHCFVIFKIGMWDWIEIVWKELLVNRNLFLV